MTFFRLVSRSQKFHFARTDETNFDLIFALLRISTHHQVINIKGIIEGIITFINQVIITDILKGIFNGIFKSTSKASSRASV